MAEESINLQQDDDNSRRNSTGKSVTSKSSEKIVPHYLRASTGSCHDFCKYGRKHAFEEKARHPIRKNMATKSVDSLQALHQVDILVPLGEEKASLVRLKHSPLKAHSPDLNVHSPNVSNINKQQMLTKSLDNQNYLGRNVRGLQAERKKTSLSKLKSSPPSKPRTYEPPTTIKQEASTSTDKLGVSLKQGSSRPKEKNLAAKQSTSPKPKSVTKKAMSSPESLGGLHVDSKVKIGKRTGTSEVQAKKVLTSPRNSVSPKPSVSRVASLNSRKRWSLKKVLSPLKSQNNIKRTEPKQPKNDEVQEKTLYVVKMETETNTVESDENENCVLESSPPPPSLSSPKTSSLPNSLSFSSHEEEDEEESEYTISGSEDEAFSEDSEMETKGNAETLDEDQKRMPKKSGKVSAEDNGCKSSKLKFRRGKVVDIQAENNGPRRLKFRRGRVLGGNQNVKPDARRRSFKEREEVDDNDTETNPEKVVLRHQDVQGRKDAQGLFNNVIEETASKLVETRKSKVKALVGAFETVISLQDTKPSANTVA